MKQKWIKINKKWLKINKNASKSFVLIGFLLSKTTEYLKISEKYLKIFSVTAAFNMKTTATAVEKQKWLSYNKSFTKVLTASPNSVDPHFFVS